MFILTAALSYQYCQLKNSVISVHILTVGDVHGPFKGLFTPSESDSESEKDQRSMQKHQRRSGKHQRKCSLFLLLSFGVNRPLNNTVIGLWRNKKWPPTLFSNRRSARVISNGTNDCLSWQKKFKWSNVSRKYSTPVSNSCLLSVVHINAQKWKWKERSHLSSFSIFFSLFS